MITHASLFTGIGGFDLAAEWMGWQNVFQCEIDKYCNKLLNQNFPNTIKYGNIKETDFSPHKNKITILTGGFPCQPVSVSGKRNGSKDERWLWDEMYRTIRQVEPAYIVAENVPGLLTAENGVLFEQVCADLEAAGYEVQPFIIPAASHNAPHKRDRVWFVAYSARWRGRILRNGEQKERARGSSETQFIGILNQPDAANTASAGFQKTRSKQPAAGITGNNTQNVTTNANSTPAKHAIQTRRRGHQNIGIGKPGQLNQTRTANDWANFPTQPPVCGRNDGLPNRVDRIKALGNAIVPQVVLPIFQFIEWHIHNH